MRRRHGLIAMTLGAALMGLSGCQGTTPPRRSAAVASSEPSLAMPGDPEPGRVASKPPTRKSGIVDRHPLLSKPRDLYDQSGNNTIVKAAGATLVGIPLGVYGELKQIVVGRPPDGVPR